MKKIRIADGVYGLLMIIIGSIVAMYIIRIYKGIKELVIGLFGE